MRASSRSPERRTWKSRLSSQAKARVRGSSSLSPMMWPHLVAHVGAPREQHETEYANDGGRDQSCLRHFLRSLGWESVIRSAVMTPGLGRKFRDAPPATARFQSHAAARILRPRRAGGHWAPRNVSTRPQVSGSVGPAARDRAAATVAIGVRRESGGRFAVPFCNFGTFSIELPLADRIRIELDGEPRELAACLDASSWSCWTRS
jgi:hypothetical protein